MKLIVHSCRKNTGVGGTGIWPSAGMVFHSIIKLLIELNVTTDCKAKRKWEGEGTKTWGREEKANNK